MLYQIWSYAVSMSHGLLPCLSQRYTHGAGRLELLTVQVLNVELKQWGHTHVYSTSCGEDGSFWAGSKAGKWTWSNPLLPDSQQLIVMPMACGMSQLPARLGSCLWMWSCKMASTALECDLLSVLWLDVQIAWDLHWLEDLGLENPGSWVSLGSDQLSEDFTSGNVVLNRSYTLFPLLMASEELW